VTEWKAEALSGPAFTEMRHPRTLAGVDDKGYIWLVAIDGRQPDRAVGMNFAELQRLCDRLHITDALNLDGGGSTTMVVKGEIKNKPSDAAGPRPVSDALIVTIR
jgi:exopolysaccharide biosynthesis protein